MSDMEHKVESRPEVRRRPSLRVIIGVSVLLCACTIGLFAYLTGHFAIIIKQPNERTIAISQVCDSNDAKKFNDNVQSGDFLDASKIDSMVKNIKIRQNADMDPTCVGILAYGALAVRDVDALETYVRQLKEMKNKGLYMNDDVAFYMSTPYAESMLGLLKSGGLPSVGAL